MVVRCWNTKLRQLNEWLDIQSMDGGSSRVYVLLHVNAVIMVDE